MLTVGPVAQHLSTLDLYLPIGIIDIDRHPGSQRVTISLRVLTDVDVIHEPRTGEPQAVWLTAQPSAGQSDPLTARSPSTVVLPRHRCGCLILVADIRSVNLDAFPCPHHQPDSSSAPPTAPASEPLRFTDAPGVIPDGSTRTRSLPPCDYSAPTNASRTPTAASLSSPKSAMPSGRGLPSSQLLLQPLP